MNERHASNRPVALVTGAARGIGRAIALNLGARGFDVVVNDTAELDPVEGTVAELHRRGLEGSYGTQGDVSDGAYVSRMLDECESRVGVPAALVCNAGIEYVTPFLEIDQQEFERVIDVNLKSQFLLGGACARRMAQARTSGAIVNMSSIQAVRAVRGRGHYGPSKAAILQLTRLMAVELADYGIRVNAVAPGLIRTDMTAGVLSDPETREPALRAIPLGRPGTPDEVASAVGYLLSEEASYITGTTVFVDGGMAAI